MEWPTEGGKATQLMTKPFQIALPWFAKAPRELNTNDWLQITPSQAIKNNQITDRNTHTDAVPPVS